MNTQLWVQGEDRLPLEKCAFAPVTTGERTYRMKPETGGLWTSTYKGDHGSPWIQWCLIQGFEVDPDDPMWGNCWLLGPAPDARVYVIDSYDDLDYLCKRYKTPDTHSCPVCDELARVRWETVAEDYDAVHLTEDGSLATRYSEPYTTDMWSCESTLWLHWKFEKVEPMGACTFRTLFDQDEVAA